MSRRRPFQSRIQAARTVRDIMCHSESLDCNHSKLRSLCALLYCVASEEPKASYKYKMSEVKKYHQSEIEEYEKSDDCIVVESLCDLVGMAIGVLIEKVSDDEPEVQPDEKTIVAGIRIKKEIFESERMILSEEEVQMRESEFKKIEENNKSVQFKEKERTRKANYRTRQKEELNRLEKVMRRMEEGEAEMGMNEMEEDDEMGQGNGIKKEPIDDECSAELNPMERILNLCQSVPSSSRIKDEPVDQDDVIPIEPSNFMTRTRARMERLGRMNGRIEERGEGSGIVGGTAVIRGVKRVHSTVFESTKSNYDDAIARPFPSYIPTVKPFIQPILGRPGASLLKSRLERLNAETISPPPSSEPIQTLRSILQSEIPSHTIGSNSVRTRVQPNE